MWQYLIPTVNLFRLASVDCFTELQRYAAVGVDGRCANRSSGLACLLHRAGERYAALARAFRSRRVSVDVPRFATFEITIRDAPVLNEPDQVLPSVIIAAHG
jgi:hypothetical protein